MEPVLLLGLSGPEAAIIVAVIILLFGATRIPQVARALGRAQGEFKKGRDEAAADAELLEEARRLGIPTEGRDVAAVRADVDRARNR